MYRSMILTNVGTKPISSVLQTYQLHPNRVCSPRFCPDFHRKPQRRRGRLAMASSTLRGGGERLVRREIKVDCFAPTSPRKTLVDNPRYNRKCDFADLQMGLQKASNRPHREQGDDTTGVSPSKCWKHPITGRAPQPCDDRKPDDLVSS